jgi:hypothetical protein
MITLQQNDFIPVGLVNIEIISQFGLLVMQITIQQEDWKHAINIEIADLKPGIYILRVSDREKYRTLKFIKMGY